MFRYIPHVKHLASIIHPSSIHSFIHLPAYLSFHQSTSHFSIQSSTKYFIHPSVHPPTNQSSHHSDYSSVNVCVCSSICSTPSIHLFFLHHSRLDERWLSWWGWTFKERPALQMSSDYTVENQTHPRKFQHPGASLLLTNVLTITSVERSINSTIPRSKF